MKEVKIFVSYSSKDRNLKNLLISGLESHLRNDPKTKYKFWSDKEIDLGANWKTVIETALQSSQAALLLVSAYLRHQPLSRKANYLSFLKGTKISSSCQFY